MFPFNFIRFSKRPPGKKPPPKNKVDLYWDAENERLTVQTDEGVETPIGGGSSSPAPGSLVEWDDNGTLVTPVFYNTFALKDTSGVSVEFSATELTTSVSYECPEANGTLGVLRPYADSTAANAAVSVGDAWWDTTLKKVRVRLT